MVLYYETLSWVLFVSVVDIFKLHAELYIYFLLFLMCYTVQ